MQFSYWFVLVLVCSDVALLSSYLTSDCFKLEDIVDALKFLGSIKMLTFAFQFTT